MKRNRRLIIAMQMAQQEVANQLSHLQEDLHRVDKLLLNQARRRSKSSNSKLK